MGRRLLPRLRQLLSHRSLPLAAAIVATSLAAPSLTAGLRQDDYLILAVLSGPPPLAELYPAPLDVFDFVGGSRERSQRMLDLGLLPWWTDPAIQIRFWRPASALTHWLDSASWPDLPVMMHAHSLLWFAALNVAVGLAYRRFMGPSWAAGLAVVLYAVDGGHAEGAGWVAYRNGVLGALWGVVALVAHDRWRRDGWRPGAVVGPAGLALSVLSAEAGAGTAGYLLAHAAALDRAPWTRRLAALVPYGVTLVLWQAVYHGLGYGVRGYVPEYISPVREPVEFAGALLVKAPVHLLSQWLGPLSDPYLYAWPRPSTLGTAAVVVGLAAALLPLLRRDPVARFWALGHVLAVVPLASAPLGRRYLFLVGVGAMGLLARAAWSLAHREPWPGRPVWIVAALVAAVLGWSHLVLAPRELFRASTEQGETVIERAAHTLPDDPAFREQIAVVANVPIAVWFSYSFFVRAVQGRPIAAHTRLLTSGPAPATLARLDERTLRVRQEGPPDRTFRAPGRPMARRQRIRLTGTEIEVTRVTRDGWPAEWVLRFDVPLEDATLRWLRWRSEDGGPRYVSFAPPAVGETLLLR
jgi:hypothetical protein